MTVGETIVGVLEGTAIADEIHRSRKRFPDINPDLLRAVTVMVEEAGEALKAVRDYERNGRRYPADLLALITETEQTVASGIRLLTERLYPELYGDNEHVKS